MKLLVLGGTQFVGRHIIEAALVAGHDVTIFNRGITNPGLFPQVEFVKGDRDGGLERLSGRSWDAVIDTCGYLPRVVKQSADAMADCAAQYVFISTVSVYAPEKGASRVDERTPVATTDNPDAEPMTLENYGALKVLCENVVRDNFPTRGLFIRPGIIVGPHEPTGRFTYWVQKAAQGGTAVAPGDGTQPIQFIDARDLAQWVVALVERRTTGFFNAVGPSVPMTMRRLLDQLKAATSGDTNFVWVDNEILKQQKTDLPLWSADKDDYWIFSVDPARAIGAGLVLRPVSDTAKDVHAWLKEQGTRYRAKVGLTPQQESLILSLPARGEAS